MLPEEEFEDPKGQSQSVNQRRTDNTMAKRNRTDNDLQNTTQKIYHRATQSPVKKSYLIWLTKTAFTPHANIILLLRDGCLKTGYTYEKKKKHYCYVIDIDP